MMSSNTLRRIVQIEIDRLNKILYLTSSFLNFIICIIYVGMKKHSLDFGGNRTLISWSRSTWRQVKNEEVRKVCHSVSL